MTVAPIQIRIAAHGHRARVIVKHVLALLGPGVARVILMVLAVLAQPIRNSPRPKPGLRLRLNQVHPLQHGGLTSRNEKLRLLPLLLVEMGVVAPVITAVAIRVRMSRMAIMMKIRHSFCLMHPVNFELISFKPNDSIIALGLEMEMVKKLDQDRARDPP